MPRNAKCLAIVEHTGRPGLGILSRRIDVVDVLAM